MRRDDEQHMSTLRLEYRVHVRDRRQIILNVFEDIRTQNRVKSPLCQICNGRGVGNVGNERIKTCATNASDRNVKRRL